MIRKYAKAEVVEIRSSPVAISDPTLSKFASFGDYKTNDGYLYVRARAISSRVNANNDGWPTVELAGGPEAWKEMTSKHQSSDGFTVESKKEAKIGYSTFVGKPIFVDHHNSNPDRARGVIVDSKFRVLDKKTASTDPYWSSNKVSKDHAPASEVELLMEVDAKSFPKFAKAIVDRTLDGFSMGCFVPGTPITLADGTKKPIETVEVGDQVLTHTGKIEPVTYVMAKPHNGIVYEVNSYGQSVPMTLTEEHPVWTKNGWVEAKDLDVGDYVLSPTLEIDSKWVMQASLGDDVKETKDYHLDEQGLWRRIRSITEKKYKGTVYNFDVEGDDSYVAADVAVHNCDIGYSKCSHCGNEASSPSEYCKHIQSKGADHDYKESDGSKTSKKSYEDCYKIAFFEISGVFDPADETALTKEVISSVNDELGHLRTASKLSLSEPGVPQGELPHAPAPVHTLREEIVCQQCGSPMDDVKCRVCGFEIPPKQFQNPDLSQHVNTAEPTGDIQSLNDPNAGAYGMARNPQAPQMVSSDGSKTKSATPTMLTARNLIEVASKIKEKTQVSDETKTAAEPSDPVGKPDVKTDVTAEGGIVDASNEATSKPDKKETLDAHATGDDSGFKSTDKKIEGTPKGTDTFNDKHQLPSAVSAKEAEDEVEKAAKDTSEGEEVKEASDEDEDVEPKTAAEPSDPIGKADKQIDVTEPPHDQTGPNTQTWHGTDGNGVTKQQSPVTKDKQSKMVSIAAIQLTDTEVEMGLIDPSARYARMAELSETSDSDIAAEFRALSKVKTARKASAPSGLARVPSLSQSTRTASRVDPVDQAQYDSALFSR